MVVVVTPMRMGRWSPSPRYGREAAKSRDAEARRSAARESEANRDFRRRRLFRVREEILTSFRLYIIILNYYFTEFYPLKSPHSYM